MELLLVPLFLALALAPPVYAIFKTWRIFKTEDRRFQFGIPELLTLPILLIPATLSILEIKNHRDPMWMFFVAYQLPFAFWAWAREPRNGWGGWKPAAALISGSVGGMLVLYLWVIIVIVCCGFVAAFFGVVHEIFFR